MSLRVWLPLNGDLTNNGLSDVVVTNNGATVDNGGKIGKCYKFNNTAALSTHIDVSQFVNHFSFSGWVKYTSTTSAQYIFHLGGATWQSKYALSEDYSGTIVYYIDGTENRTTLSTANTLNQWVHYVYTYDGSTVKIYVNGTLGYSASKSPGSFTPSDNLTFGARVNNSAGTAFAYGMQNGYLNDVRIYDHVLSPKEVKLLSQGLVCHYKLNDIVQPNLLKQELRSYTPTGYEACRINFTENMVANETYTVQLWDVDVSHTGKTAANLGVDLYWGGGSLRMCYWHGTSYFTDGHADYLTATFTVTSSQASGSGSGNLWFNVYNSVGSAGDKYLHIGKWKMEKGSVATPWTQSSADSYYSSENIVYDSSGYNNHSTLNLSTSVSSDSPRNLVSTLFGAKDTPKSTFINTSLLSSLTNCTVCWWEKPITTADMLIFSSDTTHYIGAGSTSRAFYDSIIGSSGISFYRDGVLCTTTYSGNNVYHGGTKHIQNEWHHYALSGINLSSWTQFYINTYSGFPTQSYLSDVRIYATALSAADIQELYNAPVSVANTGAMLTQGEFVEVAT